MFDRFLNPFRLWPQTKALHIQEIMITSDGQVRNNKLPSDVVYEVVKIKESRRIMARKLTTTFNTLVLMITELYRSALVNNIYSHSMDPYIWPMSC